MSLMAHRGGTKRKIEEKRGEERAEEASTSGNNVDSKEKEKGNRRREREAGERERQWKEKGKKRSARERE